MKTMIKLYSFTCFLCSLILITSCGATEPPTEAESLSPPQETAPLDSRWLEIAPLPETDLFGGSWTGDFDELAERRLIRVLTVYGAGRYYLDHGSEKGLTYEIMKGFETYINKQMNKGHVKVHVVFIPVARNQLIPSLLAGRGDIIVAGLTATPQRQAQVDFTIPSSKPLNEILVTGPTAEPLESIDDLSGRTIYVRQSSSYRESVEELNDRLIASGKAPVVIEPVSESLEDDDLIEMVNSGLLPWAIVDSYKPQLWEQVFTDLTIREDIIFKSGTRLAWAMRKDSPQFMDVSNQFLKKNRQGTLIGNVLSNRYIRDFDWAANALSSGDFARFKNLEKLFRTYGEQYGFDYLMIAAQGYQESRLNQNTRSSAGAVGVMQLLPSTAKDPNVGIPDIYEVDANIHAGTKYMRFLRDRYFSDPAISPMDQTLLALAAYNAGPRRMINLRNKAEKLGYNPNVWFDNVEMVAAKEIGRETVQYVANIFKYYVSYRLTMEQELQRAMAREKVGIPTNAGP
jgi:membrane-bound lytic murein transglycosylase MltF